MVKAFILDFDGTLIDSHEVHVKSFTGPLHSRGLFTTQRDLKKFFGLQEEEILTKLFPDISKKVLNEIMKEKRMEFIKNVNIVKKKECADELLKTLNSKGVVALATNCHESEVLAVINYFNWSHYFKEVVSSYEVSRPKPALDILLFVIKILKVKQEECVFIGDTVYDAMSAQAAGIEFIGVNNNPEVIEEFKALGVKKIHKDLCSISSF